MALTISDDLLTAFSRQTTVDLYANSVWAALLNRDYEQDISGAYDVEIQDVTIPATVTTRTRGSNWKTPTEQSATQIKMAMDQTYEVVQKMSYEDIRQSPDIGWLERMRAKAAINTAAFIDANIAAYVASLTFDAADKLAVGSGNTNVLTLTGPNYYKGTGLRLVTEAARQAARHFYRKNVISGQSLDGQTAGTLWMLISPELFSVLQLDMLDRGFQWDQLTDQVLDNRIRTQEGWSGRLFGIDIIVSNSVAVPATSGSNKWVVYVGTRKALTMAIDQPVTSFFEPGGNITGPNYQLNQAGIFGRARVNPSLITEITFATADS
ncbi:MAG: hypothetical protein OXQ29_18025 [Rhodospirillaceae bacterium]|nr:hypothetical protein [Rhodospirillaceae bacterium]